MRSSFSAVLQFLGDPVERRFEPILEVLDAEEADLVGPLGAPFLESPAYQVAAGVAAADAALLQDVDLLAQRPAQVAAGQAADRPAHGGVAAAEMGDVLLGLVGLDERQPFRRQRTDRARRQAVHAAEHVDAPARVVPVLLAFPLEEILHGVGHPPALDVAEPGQDRPGGGQSELVDQFLAEVAVGDAVDDDRALAGEADDPVFGVELQQLAHVQIVDLHAPLHLFDRHRVIVTGSVDLHHHSSPCGINNLRAGPAIAVDDPGPRRHLSQGSRNEGYPPAIISK